MSVASSINPAPLGIALLAGILIGALVPLSGGGGGEQSSPGASVVRQSSSRAPTRPQMVIPDIQTPEWARACAEDRPGEFYLWMLKASPQPSSMVVMEFFSAWIARDPDSAFQAALSLPPRFDFNEHSPFFVMQLRQVFARDPMCALRWASRIDGVLGRANMMRGNHNAFTEAANPDEIRALLGRGPINGTSEEIAISYADYLAATDLAAAIQWGESLPVEYQNAVLPMMLMNLSKTDPAAALEYIKNAPSNVRQYAAIFALAYSTRPVAEDLKWVETEIGVTAYKPGLCNLIERFYHQVPEQALDYIVAIDDPEQKKIALRSLASIYSRDAEKAVSWIVTLPADLRTEAAHSAMLEKMPREFSTFANPLKEQSLTGQDLEDYTQTLAKFVVGEIVTNYGRTYATQNIASTAESLAVLQKWLRENPGPARDRLIQVLHDASSDQQDLRDQIFSDLSPNELSAILNDR